MHPRTPLYNSYRSTQPVKVCASGPKNYIESRRLSSYDEDVELRRKVVGYCRVSTEQQADYGISLDAQRQQITSYCKRNDLDIIDLVVDGGQSGKDLDRPGFRRVIEILEAGHAYGLVISKLDRLSRSIIDICKLVDKYFANQRFLLLSASENIDTQSATGRLHLYLLRAPLAASTVLTATRLLRSVATAIGDPRYGSEACF